MNRSESMRLLGISTFPKDIDEVKEAYRRQAKRFHPDSGGDDRSFTALTDAYHTLMNDRQIRTRKTVNRVTSVDVVKMGRLLIGGSMPQLRKFAAESLGQSGKRSAYAYLKYGLADSDESVRIASIRAVGRLHIRQSVGLLRSMFRTSSSTQEVELLHALLRIPGGIPSISDIIRLVQSREAKSLLAEYMKRK